MRNPPLTNKITNHYSGMLKVEACLFISKKTENNFLMSEIFISTKCGHSKEAKRNC